MGKQVVTTDLPYDEDAEKAVLGAALISNEAAAEVATLTEDDFYLAKHKYIIRAILNLINVKHVSVEAVTVMDELINMKKEEEVGGMEYLKECCDSMVSLPSLGYYKKVVNDQSVLRSMLQTIRSIDNDYRTKPFEDVNSFIGECETRFRTAIAHRQISDFISSKSLGDEAIEKVVKAQPTGDGVLVGIDTGYERLNYLTQGFLPGTVTIIAGRPGLGKTSFALNLAYKVAAVAKKAVGIFSIEMTKEMIFNRLIACNSGVPMQKLNTHRLNNVEKQSVLEAINKLSSTSIYVDDTSGIMITDLLAKARRLIKQEPNLGLLVIDYLGLINVPDKITKRNDSRQETVRFLSATIKELARELNLPIVVLCQVSRDVEKRDSRRLMISDLRESGAIEQDADVIMLMNRPDYYADQDKGNNKKVPTNANEMNARQRMNQALDNLPNNASYVEVNVAKNRHGQTGYAQFFFFKDTCRFDVPPDEYLNKVAERVAKGNLED